MIEILLSKLAPSNMASVNRISCRLYGGWFEQEIIVKEGPETL